MNPNFQDPRLQPIRRKVEAQERLSYEDGLTLYRTPDLLGVGWMANQVRERLHEAMTRGDGLAGAHCIHELWMRAELGFDIDATLDRLWKRAASSIPGISSESVYRHDKYRHFGPVTAAQAA